MGTMLDWNRALKQYDDDDAKNGVYSKMNYILPLKFAVV